MVVTDNFFATVFEQDNITKVYTTTKANLGTHYQYQIKLMSLSILPNGGTSAPDIDIFHEKYTYT